MLYCNLWPVRLYHVFPHYLINGEILGKKLLNIKCVFWFSLQLLSEIFLNPGTIQQYIIRLGFHVNCQWFLLGFDEAWKFHGSFRKNAQISDFLKICLVRSRVVRLYGLTYMTKPKVIFFAISWKRLKMICPSYRLDVTVFGFHLRVSN